MKRIWKIAGTITLILFFFVSLTNGLTITVGTGLGYDYDTIQAAIDSALEAKKKGTEQVIVFNFSGHGHFDMGAYAALMDGTLVPEKEMTTARDGEPVPQAT